MAVHVGGGSLESTVQPALPTWQVILAQKQDVWHLKNNIQGCHLASAYMCTHAYMYMSVQQHSVYIIFLFLSHLNCS